MTKKPARTSPDALQRVKKTKTKDDAKKQRKRLEKELDSLWGKIAHSRVKNCQWPGCINTERLTAHHFFHKAQGLHARWNLKNAIILCYGHHIFQCHTKGDVEPIRDILIRNIGQEQFDVMKSDVRRVWKPSLEDLTVLRDEFQGILDEFIVRDCGL
jgi:hypothetical protein